MFRLLGIWIGCFALFAHGTVATAQEVQSSGPVFKRVAATKPGSAPKITVQINPDEYFAYFNPELPEDNADVPAALPEALPEGLPHAAFWEAFKANGQPLAMNRIEDALRKAPAQAPRLDAMQSIADAHGTDILLATVGKQVSPALVLAVISVESAGRADATSHAGAQGLMQLIPATAERFGVEDAYDPGANIKGGAAYLDWLMREFNGNPVHVLAAYNAGENAVKKHDGAPPYAETRAYVPKVLAAWQVARGLCQTPPDLISDGCVLKKREDVNSG